MNAKLEAREPVARYLATPPLLQHFDRVAQAPGGVARLRELILTLAVRGKLVPQDPADEPASVLLERIREEKARLVKAGTIRKEKPLAAIAEEEKQFDLPMGWEWVRLGDAFILEYGSSLPEKNRKPGAFPVYGSNGIVGTHNQPLISQPSLVIGRKGSVGAVNLADKPFWPIDTSYFVTPPEGVNLRYAYHLFSSLKLGKHDKATAIPGINRSDVYREIVAIPPSHEQSRIVARVEELMALCDALEEKGRLAAAQHERLAGALFDALANSASAEEAADHWQRIAVHFDLLLDRPAAVDRLEQAILQLAVRGRLVPQNPADEPAGVLLQKIRAEKNRLIAAGQLKRDKPLPPISDEEKPFDLPEGWEWVRAGATFEFLNGYAFKSETFQNSGVRLLRNINVAHGTVNWAQTAYVAPSNISGYQQFSLDVGDLVLSLDRPLISTGLKYAVIRDCDIPCLLLQRVAKLTPIQKSIEIDFAKLWLTSALFTSAIDPGRSNGIPHISTKQVEQTLLPLPPISEQSRIVARVAELRAVCAQLRNRLTTTAQTRSRLAEALLEQAVA